MKKMFGSVFLTCSFLVFGSLSAAAQQAAAANQDTVLYPEESHFKNIRQLTFGGDNAEAYWSFDGKSVVFQRTSPKDGLPCDQIFYGKLPKGGGSFLTSE